MTAIAFIIYLSAFSYSEACGQSNYNRFITINNDVTISETQHEFGMKDNGWRYLIQKKLPFGFEKTIGVIEFTNLYEQLNEISIDKNNTYLYSSKKDSSNTITVDSFMISKVWD